MGREYRDKIALSPHANRIYEAYNHMEANAPSRVFAEIVQKIDPDISATTVYRWMKRQDKLHAALKMAEERDPQDLMTREIERRKQQIELRQDATSLMRDFIANIRQLATNPKYLAQMNEKTIVNLYRTIRQEEDRQKELGLKERAENRADAQFAFMLSITKANQVTDEDIEFLSDDIKEELKGFKRANGIFQLPNPKSLEELSVPAEVATPLPDQGNQEGTV